MTRDRLVEEMHGKLSLPGVSNAWTMPIKARIDMLTTGIRTPAGIKIYGRDLGEIERIGLRIEELLKPVEGTRSVYAERVTGGYFIDFAWKRDALARYGLTIDEAQMLVMNAIGGDSVNDHGRGPRALSRQRAVFPRLPRGPGRAARGAGARLRRPRLRAGEGAGGLARRQRPGHDPQRKRNARRLCVHRHRRLRHRLLRGAQRAARAGRKAPDPAGILARMERPVRGDGAGAGKAEAGRAADARAHRAAALPEHALGREDGDRAAGRSRFPPWAPCGCSTGWATT